MYFIRQIQESFRLTCIKDTIVPFAENVPEEKILLEVSR